MARKKKYTKDYRNTCEYDVIVINGKDCLIETMNNAMESVRYYVKNKKTF